MSSPANTNNNEISVKGLSKEERQNMRNEMKKNKELEKERMKQEKEAAKLKAKEDAKKAKELAKAEKNAAKLKAKEDAKAEKEADKMKAKAEKEAAKLKAKEDAKAEKNAAKLKAKEDAKTEKNAAKLKAKEDANAEKDTPNLKTIENINSDNHAAHLDIDNSLEHFISQFKNHNLTLSNDVDFESFDDDMKRLVHFYLFTHLIYNDSTPIESFKKLDWLFIYNSFKQHSSTFYKIFNNNNDIVSDLIYQANSLSNDIDIDVKLHIINGQKVLIDSHNVCYHFNHHKPIGKLLNNNIILF